jgi:multiple sugar transport system permease protein
VTAVGFDIESATTEVAARDAADGSRRSKGPRRSARSPWLKDSLAGIALLVPALAILGVFTYLPALLVLAISFFHWNLAGFGKSQFAGVAQYKALLNPYSGFLGSLTVTAYYVGVMVAATLALGLGLAWILRGSLRRRTRGLGFFRAVVFLPYVTPAVATSVVWVFIFNPQFGLANALLRAVGLPALGWLESSTWALPAVMIDNLWKQVGFAVVLFLAGLSRIPNDVMEAAALDRASPSRVFRQIVLPYLSPVTLVVVIITTIGAMQTFGSIYTLTGGQFGGGGGPLNSTTTTAIYLYKSAFVDFHYGYGAAVAVVMFLLMLILALVQRKLGERHTFYR